MNRRNFMGLLVAVPATIKGLAKMWAAPTTISLIVEKPWDPNFKPKLLRVIYDGDRQTYIVNPEELASKQPGKIIWAELASANDKV